MIAERSFDQVAAPEPTGVELEQEEEARRSIPAEWGLAKRMLFRFVCSYFFLYIFPFPLDYIPYVAVAAGWYQNLLNALVSWVGKHVLQVDTSILPNGSGDTTFNYVQVFCFLVLATVAMLVWTLL